MYIVQLPVHTVVKGVSGKNSKIFRLVWEYRATHSAAVLLDCTELFHIVFAQFAVYIRAVIDVDGRRLQRCCQLLNWSQNPFESYTTKNKIYIGFLPLC